MDKADSWGAEESINPNVSSKMVEVLKCLFRAVEREHYPQYFDFFSFWINFAVQLVHKYVTRDDVFLTHRSQNIQMQPFSWHVAAKHLLVPARVRISLFFCNSRFFPWRGYLNQCFFDNPCTSETFLHQRSKSNIVCEPSGHETVVAFGTLKTSELWCNRYSRCPSGFSWFPNGAPVKFGCGNCSFGLQVQNSKPALLFSGEMIWNRLLLKAYGETLRCGLSQTFRNKIELTLGILWPFAHLQWLTTLASGHVSLAISLQVACPVLTWRAHGCQMILGGWSNNSGMYISRSYIYRNIMLGFWSKHNVIWLEFEYSFVGVQVPEDWVESSY